MNQLECLRDLIKVKRAYLESLEKLDDRPPEFYCAVLGRIAAMNDVLDMLNDFETILPASVDPRRIEVGHLPSSLNT